MTESQQLEQAIAALESQRLALGDAIIDAALAPLREKLSALNASQANSPSRAVNGAGERKLVTVLFADISGFTALSERMDPESVRELMNQCFAYLVPCITQYEGTIDKFIGDEIMALFGAPLAHENDAERAVRAALEMTAALERFNAQHATSLGLHFGINTGLVLAGDIGAGVRREYSVMGDTVNLAARLEEASNRGQIFVGPDTYRLTAPLFEFEILQPIKVKGKTDPIPVYRAVGLKAKPGNVRGLETKGISSPLLGREEERATTQKCLHRLFDGHGGIVGVIGEAGLGKSRLVSEAKSFALAHSTNVLWLEGQTVSFGQTISYWPFQQILRGWAGITEEDDAGHSWSKLEQRVRDLFGDETIDYLPYLASLLALEVKGEYAERVKYLDGDAMGKQIFLTSRRFFERLACTQPTVLVFEDLHWMDESSTLLLEHLFPLVGTVPLAIFGISRPERDTPAARLLELCAHDFTDHYAEIRLAPLSGSDSAQLMDNLLDIEDMPADLRKSIVDKADGNPFFLEEVIRGLMDTGVVQRDASSGRWRATAQTETIHIPDTIQGIIMARVDRLDEEVKQVLRVASVIGRSFLYRVLKAIGEASQHLDDDLAELQSVELIREKQHLPELEFMFRHALAQEATYESILLQKRRELHARVAQAIETLLAGRLEEFYGLLAYHYARAEVWDKAQEYLLRAADQAGQLAGNAEALNLYDQALAAYGRAFGDQWDPVQRASVERKVGEALFRRGEHTQALEHLYRGLEYLGHPFPASQGKVRQAIVQELLQQTGNRLLPRLFLKNAAMSVSTAFEEEYYCYDDIAQILAFTNLEGFLLATIRFLNRSEQNHFLRGMGRGFGVFGYILDAGQAYGLAASYHRRALVVAQQLQDPRVTNVAHCFLGLHEIILGRLDAALEQFAQAVAAAQESGELRQWGFIVQCIGACLNYQGDLRHALEQGQTLVRVGQDAVALQLEGFGEMLQGLARKRTGHLGEARVHLERAIQIAATVPDLYVGALARGELVQCLARQGEITQALQILETVEKQLPGDSYTHWVHSEAEAYLLQAEQVGRSDKEEWLRKAKRACQAALKQAKTFHPGAPEAMLLQARYEWLCGRREAARRWWNRSLAEAERMGMRYDEAMTHLLMGQCLGERAHLEKAETIFVEIGAELDLAKTRQLLRRSTYTDC